MPDYSQFMRQPCPAAVRMEQRVIETGELKLTTEIMVPAGNEAVMIFIREGIQRMIKKMAGDVTPLYEEEYNRSENPEAYAESIEDYYRRTAGEINGYDPKNFN